MGLGEVSALESEMNVRDWLLEDKQVDDKPTRSHYINGGLCHLAPVKLKG